MRGEGSVLTLGRRTRRTAQKTLTPSRFRQTIGYCNVDGARFEPISSGSDPFQPVAPPSEPKSPLGSRVTCSEFLHWPLTGRREVAEGDPERGISRRWMKMVATSLFKPFQDSQG